MLPICEEEARQLADIQKEVDALSPKARRRLLLQLQKKRGYGGLKDALVFTMLWTGKSAVEARQIMIESLGSGRVHVRAKLDGEPVTVPPELFRDNRH